MPDNPRVQGWGNCKCLMTTLGATAIIIGSTLVTMEDEPALVGLGCALAAAGGIVVAAIVANWGLI